MCRSAFFSKAPAKVMVLSVVTNDRKKSHICFILEGKLITTDSYQTLLQQHVLPWVSATSLVEITHIYCRPYSPECIYCRPDGTWAHTVISIHSPWKCALVKDGLACVFARAESSDLWRLGLNPFYIPLKKSFNILGFLVDPAKFSFTILLWGVVLNWPAEGLIHPSGSPQT